MGENKKRSTSSTRPLADRIKERLRDLVDEVIGTLEGLVLPAPVPIPVRPRR